MNMQVGRLVIFTLAVLITAGEAMVILRATASVSDQRDTSETPLFAHGAKPNSPDVAPPASGSVLGGSSAGL